MNEYDLTKADIAQNRVIDRMNQRLDTFERQLAPLVPLAAQVGKHEALINALKHSLDGVSETAAHAHDLLQQIEEGPLEAFKVVKNFVDELMERVATLEKTLSPVHDALKWLQDHRGAQQ